MASAAARLCFLSGLRVVVAELPLPLAVRRLVCFAEAVRAGECAVDGVRARRVDLAALAAGADRPGHVEVVVDPDGTALARLRPAALVDGRMAKANLGTARDQAPRVIGLGPNKILSVPDAVGIAIERWMQEKQGIQQELLPGSAAAATEDAPVLAQRVAYSSAAGEQMVFGGLQETLSGACPDCGSQLEFAEGCMKCHVCGFSECG